MRNQKSIDEWEVFQKLEKALARAQSEELAAMQRAHPILREYRVKANRIIYKAKPEGSSKIIPAIMEYMLTDDAIGKTNKALVEHVAEGFPEHNIAANIMNKKLQPWAIKKIEKIAKDRVDVTGCKTLSEIRKRIKAGQRTGHLEYLYSGKIRISKNGVLVGKQLFSIETNKAKDKEYKVVRVNLEGDRYSIRVEAVVALLSAIKTGARELK